MSHESDFAPIAARIRQGIAGQGFMKHVGADITELALGLCVISVDRRSELLQQNGFFHGGVTAFLIDNATTIAAATARGQSALTAEYKLNFLSPASGARLICRARGQTGTTIVDRRRRRVLPDRWRRETHRNRARLDCHDRPKRCAENHDPGLRFGPGLLHVDAYLSAAASSFSAGSSSWCASGSKNSPAAAKASAAAS